MSISKRLKDAPAVVVGDVSASMRVMMKMIDQTQFDEANKNQVLEINPNHPLIVKLNQIRKTDQKVGTLVAKQLLDTVFLNAGLPIDVGTSVNRTYAIMDKYLDDRLDVFGDSDEDVIIEEMSDEEEPIFDEANKKKKSEQKIKVEEIKVE